MDPNDERNNTGGGVGGAFGNDDSNFQGLPSLRDGGSGGTGRNKADDKNKPVIESTADDE